MTDEAAVRSTRVTVHLAEYFRELVERTDALLAARPLS